MGRGGKRSTPEKRVQRGAAFLDKVKPDWFTKIDLGSLDLASGCDCVLGQIVRFEADKEGMDGYVSDYCDVIYTGPRELQWEENPQEAAQLDREVTINRVKDIDDLSKLVMSSDVAKARGFHLVNGQMFNRDGTLRRSRGGAMASREWEALTDFWKAAIIERRMDAALKADA